MLIPKLSVITALALASCALHRPAVTAAPEAAQEIRYVSSDLRFVMVFSNGSARSGNFMALSPGLLSPFPTREIETNDRVRCLSMGPSGSSVEFAIRRPIRAGDRYRCLATSFLVTRCFGDCRAAIIEVAVPLSGGINDTRKAYMYVDTCVGLLVYGDTGDLAEGIPVSAAWLRGEVGILADRNYPECNRF